MASVKLINVNKVYDGGVHAVHDFNIDIADREFIVFVGPSGCGKSTTLRMIAGLEEISYGEFLIDGELKNSAAPKDRDIAMVFQSYALYPQMTVYNNMAYALKLRKIKVPRLDKDGNPVIAIDQREIKQLERAWKKFEKECVNEQWKVKNAFQLRIDALEMQLRGLTADKEEEKQKINGAIQVVKTAMDTALKALSDMRTTQINLAKENGDTAASGIEEKKQELTKAAQSVGINIEELLKTGLEKQIKKNGETLAYYKTTPVQIYDLKHMPKADIDARIKEAARILKLTPYLDRKPRALSGGQRQRVALGRAIVRRPKVFLMDEPLSNLDAKLRVAMRSEIVRIHEEVGATTIYVTHDQIEAMTMASRIVVMKDGFIQQIGAPNEVYRNPANMFVAGFIGTPAMNFLRGTVEKGYFKIDVTGEKIKLTKEQTELLKNYEGKRLVYGIRPENLIYQDDEKFAEFKDCTFKMEVSMVELLGDIVNVHGFVNDKEVILKTGNLYQIKDKTEIKVAIDSNHARFFNETTTKAITPDYCEYEEIEVTKSLDEDNVVIIEQKKGLFAKAVDGVKNLIGSIKEKSKAKEQSKNSDPKPSDGEKS
ncbi:MAG: ATP-binding cassette domain-containing protein [Clostridia bacterium]|nr:ATP-binding cassette domain-containing protein [Clostridia bacterium]